MVLALARYSWTAATAGMGLVVGAALVVVVVVVLDRSSLRRSITGWEGSAAAGAALVRSWPVVEAGGGSVGEDGQEGSCQLSDTGSAVCVERDKPKPYAAGGHLAALL
jgi:hypothetical protein